MKLWRSIGLRFKRDWLARIAVVIASLGPVIAADKDQIICAQGAGGCVRETEEETYRRLVTEPCFRELQSRVERRNDTLRPSSGNLDFDHRNSKQVWDDVWKSADNVLSAHDRYESCLRPALPPPYTEMQGLREELEGLREELRQFRRR